MKSLYRSEIDGMRALAVLSVILFHAGFTFIPGGYVGVDVFFVISGFLITRNILIEMEEERFSFLNFYERRARRILPALYFVLICTIPFAIIWMLPSELASFSRIGASVVLFLSNIFIWLETGYFSPNAEEKPLLHMWSLSIEEQFYFILPLMIFMLWRFGKQKLFIFLSLCAVASLALSELGWRVHSSANFYLLPTRFWELASGSLAAFAAIKFGRQSNTIIATSGMGLILSSMALMSDKTPFPSLLAVIPVLGSVLIILFAGPKTWVYKILSLKPIVGIGLISYSAYLWHQPLFAFARINSEGIKPSLVLMSILGLISLLLAYFSWRFVEQPFRRKDKKWLANKKHYIIALMATSASLASMGLIGHVSQGWVTRYAPEDRLIASMEDTKQGDYVKARFSALLKQPFSQNDRPKALVIGDSYGQDFVNALFEGGLSYRFDISTYYISSKCGNLMIEALTLPDDSKIKCSNSLKYSDPILLDLMEKADTIFLASSWKEWHLPYLSESLENIGNSTNAKVYLVGTKNFGNVTPRTLLSVPYQDRPDYSQITEQQHRNVVASMEALNYHAYIDVDEVFCDASHQADIFDMDGKPYSYDGGHLTLEGAKKLGAALPSLILP